MKWLLTWVAILCYAIGHWTGRHDVRPLSMNEVVVRAERTALTCVLPTDPAQRAEWVRYMEKRGMVIKERE